MFANEKQYESVEELKLDLERKFSNHLKENSKFNWITRAEKAIEVGIELSNSIKKNENLSLRFNEKIIEEDGETNYEINTDNKPEKAICIIPAFYNNESLVSYGRLSSKKNSLPESNFEYIFLKKEGCSIL